MREKLHGLFEVPPRLGLVDGHLMIGWIPPWHLTWHLTYRGEGRPMA